MSIDNLSIKQKEELSDDLYNMMINLNRFLLEDKPHIQKYYKMRRLHGEVVDSMMDYIYSGKYNVIEKINEMSPYIDKEVYNSYDNLSYRLDLRDENDVNIIAELCIYKNHKELKSLTEEYIEKRKFRKEDKIKMLGAMNNSYVGLFKATKIDKDNAYVYYEDVFTKKKFKVIDIAYSSTSIIDDNHPLYRYDRIITIDGISFGTGIHCPLNPDNNDFKKFMKKHEYNKFSDYYRCLRLYTISKKDGTIRVNYNHDFRK